MKKRCLSILMVCAMLLTSVSAGGVSAEELTTEKVSGQTVSAETAVPGEDPDAETALTEGSDAETVLPAEVDDAENGTSDEALAMDGGTASEEESPEAGELVSEDAPEDSADIVEETEKNEQRTPGDAAELPEDSAAILEDPEENLIEEIQVMEEEPDLDTEGEDLQPMAVGHSAYVLGQKVSFIYSDEEWTEDLYFTAPEDGGYIFHVEDLTYGSDFESVDIYTYIEGGYDNDDQDLMFTQDGSGTVALAAGKEYRIDVEPWGKEDEVEETVTFTFWIEKAEDIAFTSDKLAPVSVELREEQSRQVFFFTSTEAEDYLLDVGDLDCGATSFQCLNIALFREGMNLYKKEASYGGSGQWRIPLQANTRYCLVVWASAVKWTDPVKFRFGIGKIPELSDVDTRVEAKRFSEKVGDITVISDKKQLLAFTPKEEGNYLLTLSGVTVDPGFKGSLSMRREDGYVISYDFNYFNDLESDQTYRIELLAGIRYIFEFYVFDSGETAGNKSTGSLSLQARIEKIPNTEYIEVKNLPESPWNIMNVYEKLTSAEYIVHYSDTQETYLIENWEADGYYHSSFMNGIRLRGSNSLGDIFYLQLIGDYIPQGPGDNDNPIPIGPSSITPVGSYQLALYKSSFQKAELVFNPGESEGSIRVEAEGYPDAAEELVLGDTIQLGENQKVIYRYTPSASGAYVIEGPGQKVYVALYDDGFKKLWNSEMNGVYSPYVSAQLEEGETYYYEITSVDSKAELQFYQEDVVLIGASLISPPDKREYELGTDMGLATEGLKIQLSYSDGSTKELNGNEAHPVLRESDSEGNPNYDKSIGFVDITSAGIYWLVADIYPDVIYSSTVFHVPVRVTFINPGEHIHLWGEWQDGAAATAESDATQVRTCELCGGIETRSVEGTKLTPVPESVPGVVPQTVPQVGSQANPQQTVPSAAEAVLELPSRSLIIKTGQSTNKYYVTDMSPGDSLVSVVSSNPKLLRVSNVNPDGTFRLKARNRTGKVNLTITLASGATRTVKVKVQSTEVRTRKLRNVPKKLTLKYHVKHKLEVLVLPVTSQDKLTFTSSDSRIVGVTSKGVLKPRKVGQAKITVQSGSKKATCVVRVEK